MLRGPFRRRGDAPVPSRAGATPPARFPSHPATMLRTDAWRPLVAVADQRIRAHRHEDLAVGDLLESLSVEVGEVVAAQPPQVLEAAWREWVKACAAEGRLVPALPAGAAGAETVEAALAVHADLAALVPQLVVSRLSENIR